MGKWETDGSAQLGVKGERVQCLTHRGGNIYNAIWSDEITSGKAYWKLYVEELDREGGLFVGVTEPSRFKIGWACKGLFYGGNLSDGGAALTMNFGPKLKEGDVVGIFVDIEDRIKVYFDVNGTSLGIAFDVPKDTLKVVQPALHFSVDGTVRITRVNDFPDTTRVAKKEKGVGGFWKYAAGFFPLSPNLTPTLEMGPLQENRYLVYRPQACEVTNGRFSEEIPFRIDMCQGHIRVINTIGLVMTKQTKDATYKAETGYSTKMMGDPADMDLEKQLVRHLNGAEIILLNEDQMCVLNEKVVSNWSKFIPEPEFVTESPFRN